MQAIVCVTSTIASFGTRCSRSGMFASSVNSHGVTRWIFFQWTASMSTIRSFSTGMCHRLDLDDAVLRGLQRGVEMGVAGQPGLAVDSHAARPADRRRRHEQRMPIEPSKRPLACNSLPAPSACGSSWTVCSSQYGASPTPGRSGVCGG